MKKSAMDNCGSSGSTSISSSVVKDSGVYCKCGISSKLRMAKTEENARRRFFGCGSFNFSSYKCNFFHWYDPEHPDHLKKFLTGLIRENKKLKVDLLELDGEIVELQQLLQTEMDYKKLLVEKVESYEAKAKKMKLVMFCIFFFMVGKWLQVF